MGDILSANETVPCQPGQVVVDIGGNTWVSWANGSSHAGCLIGICQTIAFPGGPISVATQGRVPYAQFNLGAGQAGTLNVAPTGKAMRGGQGGGQVIGTCDPAGALFLWPSYVGTIAGSNAPVAVFASGAVQASTPTAGQGPVWDGSKFAWQNVVTTTSVSGTGFVFASSGTVNPSAVTLTQDVSQGALTSNTVPLTVVGLQGHAVPAPTGSSTVLTWSGSSFSWATVSGTLAGDVTGPIGSNTVVKISGAAPVNVVNAVLSFGASPATTGNIRLPGVATIYSLNQLSANQRMIATDASNNVLVGDTTNTNVTNVYAGAAAAFQTPNYFVSLIDASAKFSLGVQTMAFVNNAATPLITQDVVPSTGANAGITLTIRAQQGQAVAGGTNNNGGYLLLSSGAPGGGGTGGFAGDVQVSAGATSWLQIGPNIGGYYLASGSLMFWASATTNPTFYQLAYSGTGANNGNPLSISAQGGQTQTGTNANNNGGFIVLTPGPPGTGGSGAAGIYGGVSVNTGTWRAVVAGDYAIAAGAGSATYGAIWFALASGALPSQFNFGFLGSQSATYLNVALGGVVVLSINGTGASAVSWNGSTLTYAAQIASPMLQQATQIHSSGVAPQTFTIQSQQQSGSDEGSAALNSAGFIAMNWAAPYTTTNAGTEGGVVFKRAGAILGYIGPYPASPTGYLAVYGPNGISSSGFAFIAGTGSTIFNAPTGTSVYFRTGNNQGMIFGTGSPGELSPEADNGVQLGDATLRFHGVYTSGFGLKVYNGSGDANAVAQVISASGPAGALVLGIGGVTGPDLRFWRSAATTATIDNVGTGDASLIIGGSAGTDKLTLASSTGTLSGAGNLSLNAATSSTINFQNNASTVAQMTATALNITSTIALWTYGWTAAASSNGGTLAIKAQDSGSGASLSGGQISFYYGRPTNGSSVQFANQPIEQLQITSNSGGNTSNTQSNNLVKRWSNLRISDSSSHNFDSFTLQSSGNTNQAIGFHCRMIARCVTAGISGGFTQVGQCLYTEWISYAYDVGGTVSFGTASQLGSAVSLSLGFSATGNTVNLTVSSASVAGGAVIDVEILTEWFVC